MNKPTRLYLLTKSAGWDETCELVLERGKPGVILEDRVSA